MSEEKDTWLKMKPYLIFVAVLANFCSHGVSGGTLPEEYQKPSFFENVNTMDGKDQAGSPRILPGLPGGQSVSQSGSNSAPSTPSSTNFQPTKFQLIEKFKEFLTNLEDQLQVFNENLKPQIFVELMEEKSAGFEISSQEMLPRNPRIGDAWDDEVSHNIEMIIRSRDGYHK